MAKRKTDDLQPRRIRPGCCSQCGHPLHNSGCREQIRTDDGPATPKRTGPCPCPR